MFQEQKPPEIDKVQEEEERPELFDYNRYDGTHKFSSSEGEADDNNDNNKDSELDIKGKDLVNTAKFQKEINRAKARNLEMMQKLNSEAGLFDTRKTLTEYDLNNSAYTLSSYRLMQDHGLDGPAENNLGTFKENQAIKKYLRRRANDPNQVEENQPPSFHHLEKFKESKKITTITPAQLSIMKFFDQFPEEQSSSWSTLLR